MTRLQARRRNDLLVALLDGSNWTRPLAERLDVNPATAGRLLRELEAAELVISAQGRGLGMAKRRYFALSPQGRAQALRISGRRRISA